MCFKILLVMMSYIFTKAKGGFRELFAFDLNINLLYAALIRAADNTNKTWYWFCFAVTFITRQWNNKLLIVWFLWCTSSINSNSISFLLHFYFCFQFNQCPKNVIPVLYFYIINMVYCFVFLFHVLTGDIKVKCMTESKYLDLKTSWRNNIYYINNSHYIYFLRH